MTQEQREYIDMIRKFGEKEIKPNIAQWDREGHFPLEEVYNKLFEMGLHLIDIPEEFGGLGMDKVTGAMIFEELAKFDAGISTSLGAVSLGFKPLLVAGTNEQKQLFADLILDGGFAAFALTEPSAGSDASAVKTTAKLDGDEWVINGSKCFITCAEYAKVFTVIASTDKTKGVKGLTAFIVEADRAGISIGNHEDKMGIRTSNTCDVFFDEVRIPKDHLLGKEGEGFKIAMKTLDMARPVVGACAVGICQACVDICKDYMKTRVQFGKPIAALQGLQFMLADMEIATETARAMVLRCMQMMEDGEPYSQAAAIAKCYAGDMAMKVAVDAVQILGGYGYSREYPVEKLMRDAKIYQIFEGTNQVQRVVIANNLLR
jgi:butyryl-CoA dehydrogenase